MSLRRQIPPVVTLIRVHVGNMPRMLRAIINDLLMAEPDIVVVGNSPHNDDSFQAARAEEADLLIAHEPSPTEDTCLFAFINSAPGNILAISKSGTFGTALTRRTISLNESKSQGLAHAIREVMGAR